MGYLVDDYGEYFRSYRRTQLMKESAVEETLERCIGFQAEIPELAGIVAPNIHIPRSLDSVETVISMNFMRLARTVAKKKKIKKKIFATLAINREALFKEQEVVEFVNELTALDEPPDGFYLLVEVRNQDARSEIYNADVLAMWMYITYALTLNGFPVINGYSDLAASVLCAAQSFAGATGWWSNLRTFSIERFRPSPGGGRLPIQRYLSCSLLNRITFYELNQLRSLPGILNGLDMDKEYPEDKEPQRNREVLQSWEAIKHVLDKIASAGEGTELRLAKCTELINEAQRHYDTIERLYTLDQKSNADHLAAMREAITVFKRLAEIGP